MRDDLQQIEERLALVEQGLELTMAWHWALREQADELSDQLRAGGADDPSQRLEALERQMHTVRRTVQDLTQVIGAFDADAGSRSAPPAEARAPATRGDDRATMSPAAPAVPSPPASRARSLTHTRFAGVVAAGQTVSLEAMADGLEDGTPVAFEVGVRGEPGVPVAAIVRGGAARARWTVPAGAAPGTLLELVARAELFESRSIAIVEDTGDGGNGHGAGGNGGRGD